MFNTDRAASAQVLRKLYRQAALTGERAPGSEKHTDAMISQRLPFLKACTNMDLSRSLEELESQEWAETPFGSHVVTEAHRLRGIPLKNLSVGQIRLLIVQNIGTEYLVPIALSYLSEDPLIAATYYPGDMLESVVLLPIDFWATRPDTYRLAAKIVSSALRLLTNCDSEFLNLVPDDLARRLHQFLTKAP
jgi:hypothetical protein